MSHKEQQKCSKAIAIRTEQGNPGMEFTRTKKRTSKLTWDCTCAYVPTVGNGYYKTPLLALTVLPHD